MTSRWIHPLQGLAAVRSELDRRLHHLEEGESSDPAPVTAGAWCPALDVEETPEAFVLHAELPGMTAEALEVSADGRMLRISGERTFYAGKTTDAFRRVERTFGRFDRVVRLPADAEMGEVEAAYRDGVLTVTVPKAAAARRTTIRVASE